MHGKMDIGKGKTEYEYVIRSEKPLRFEVGADTDIYAVYCITEHMWFQ